MFIVLYKNGLRNRILDARGEQGRQVHHFLQMAQCHQVSFTSVQQGGDQRGSLRREHESGCERCGDLQFQGIKHAWTRHPNRCR